MAEKWREVPGGTDQDPRQFSDQFLLMPEMAFSAAWDRQYDDADDMRGWFWRLYGGQVQGKKILEIGSGLGFDAIHFASHGASVTCCDIAASNLGIVRRAAEARGLSVTTLHVDSLAAFDALPHDFDMVWCNGSLLHIPFAEARQECAAILEHLKPGGRWIELAYPRERWVREGSPPFSEWGKLTDGERTPWVEWYDMEKLKLRLHPYRLKANLEYRHYSDTFVWFDATVVGKSNGGPIKRLTVEAPRKLLKTPAPLWAHAWSTPLGPSPAGATVTVEIECTIGTGSVGLVLEQGGRFVSREVIVEARAGTQQHTVATKAFGDDVLLLTRNASAMGPSHYRIHSIALRETI